MRARSSPASVPVVCSVVLAGLERMRSPQHRFEQGHAVGWLVWLPWYEERHRELGSYVISGSGLNAVIVVPEEDLVFVHRAHPLNGGVHGQLVHEELFRLMDARTGPGESDPELVPLDGEGGVFSHRPRRTTP